MHCYADDTHRCTLRLVQVYRARTKALPLVLCACECIWNLLNWLDQSSWSWTLFLCKRFLLFLDYEKSPYFLGDSRASERRVRVKIIPREKRQHTACRLFSRAVIFTRARLSLALLSLRKNGDLYFYFVPINLHICWPREWKHSFNVSNCEPVNCIR